MFSSPTDCVKTKVTSLLPCDGNPRSETHVPVRDIDVTVTLELVLSPSASCTVSVTYRVDVDAKLSNVCLKLAASLNSTPVESSHRYVNVSSLGSLASDVNVYSWSNAMPQVGVTLTLLMTGAPLVTCTFFNTQLVVRVGVGLDGEDDPDVWLLAQESDTDQAKFCCCFSTNPGNLA